jgi:hypothetical protein
MINNLNITPNELKPLYDRKVFGRYVLHREPYNIQEVMLLCTHPRRICVTGRGIGKTKVGIGDDATFKTSVKPYFDQWLYGLDKPLPAKVVIIGNVKDTAKMSQENIRSNYQDSPFLYQFIDHSQFTQTNIKTINGSQILIKSATNAARGIHADMKLDKSGSIIKGPIYIYIDEYWFIENKDLIDAIVGPMLMYGGPGSQIVAYTTPFGKEGPAWDIMSAPSTKPCMQKFTIDKRTGMKTCKFDRNICEICKSKGGWRLFQVESYQNPFADKAHLLETRRMLLESGRGIVWNQEYLGIPEESAGLFFNRSHILQATSEKDDMRLWSLEELLILEKQTGDWIVGVDSNSGIKKKKQDYGVISLAKKTPGGTVELKYIQRFRYKSLPEGIFPNINRNTQSSVTIFMIEVLKMILSRLSGRIKVYVGFGYGQAIMTALENEYPNIFEYVTDSQKNIAACFVHFRAMIELNLFKMPWVDWLIDEFRFLIGVDETSDEEKLKIHKARSSWGSDITVDGLYAIAYMLSGTMEQTVHLRSGTINHSIEKPFGDRSMKSNIFTPVGEGNFNLTSVNYLN